MQKETTKTENYLKWQLAAAAITAVTLASVFGEAPKHKVVVTKTDEGDMHHQSFEREREVEVEHAHHMYSTRPRYASVTGA